MLRAAEDSLLRRGIGEFNAGDYFECHETLEELWNVLDGTPKRSVQGVLQAAVGLLHAERGNYLGACRLLRDAIGKLQDPAAGASLGLDLGEWLEGIRACLGRAEALRASGGTWAPEGLVPVLPSPAPGGGA